MINPFIDVINHSLPEPQAGLLAGILFGIKANLDKSLYQALITTGTVHIIALSGQNISILVGILSQITLVLGRKISSLVTIGGIVGFVFFVGAEPTIIRAAIMGSLSLLAVYFGRQSWSLLGLVLSALVMLFLNPAWIGTISFQLSFMATLGIILFGTEKLKKISSKEKKEFESFINEIWREIRISLRTTLAAQIFTLPLIWYYFHRISLVSPLTNILIGWTITPIMVLGFILSIVGWLFLPLGYLIGLIVWVPLTFLIAIIEVTAKIPFATVIF